MQSNADLSKYLPLSWIYSAEKNKADIVKLRKSTIWIYSAQTNDLLSLLNSCDSSTHLPVKSLLIRGCNTSISENLKKLNFKRILIGKEAVIDLKSDPFSKKSLKELITRGSKFGTVREISYSAESINNLENLRSTSAHSDEPQLKYLFVDKFIQDTRLFVFVDNEEIWQGGILISPNSPTKIQTELLLRRKNAPIGIMEALVSFIFFKLKEEGLLEWSLGEVPFVAKPKNDLIISKNQILIFLGRMIKFAYNYEGLYFFKNKFASHWENIYLCAKPRIRLYDIMMLSLKSKLFYLVLHKSFRWIKIGRGTTFIKKYILSVSNT